MREKTPKAVPTFRIALDPAGAGASVAAGPEKASGPALVVLSGARPAEVRG